MVARRSLVSISSDWSPARRLLFGVVRDAETKRRYSCAAYPALTFEGR